MTTAFALTDEALAVSLRRAPGACTRVGRVRRPGRDRPRRPLRHHRDGARVPCSSPGTAAASRGWRPAGDRDDFERRFRSAVGRDVGPADALPGALGRSIARRLDGDRRVRIPLDLRGHTPFEVAVWTKALEIPRGEVRPYGWIAAEIGKPKAVRAVGTALAHNPVPLVVPCHRVVRSDGMIGQYSMGGPDAKRRILAAEGLDTRCAGGGGRARGHRYTGSDTTHIVCHPTCRDARRVTDRHRVSFPSLAAAASAGYRPCKHCRPVSLAA